jgi:uncharacterized protein (TIRG00374 family)
MKWQAILGIMVSLGLGLFVVSKVDLGQLGTALHSARYSYLALAILAQVCTHALRVWRWKYLIAPVKSVSLLSLLSATAIGFMANMVLPAHAGEVVRAYVIGRKEQISTVAGLATIVVERLADLVSFVLVVLLVVLSPNLPLMDTALAEGLRIGGLLTAGLGILLIGSLWLLQAETARMLRLLEYSLRPLPHAWRTRVLAAVTSFASGLHAFRNGRHLLAVLGLSLGLWTLIAYSNLLVFRAFDLQLPLTAAYFILIVQLLSAAVPSGPGFIGTFHAAVVAGLSVFQITQELALSMAIMMHATFFFPFIGIGLIFLWRESLSLRDLKAVKAR